MQRKSLFLIGLLGLAGLCLKAYSQAAMPAFSNESKETWYHLKFHTGGAVLQDKGEAADLLTATLSLGNEAQLWKLVGNAESFTLVGKSGRRVYLENSFFKTSERQSTPLQLVPSGHAAAPDAWEIRPAGASQHLNQYQGSGANRRLSLWTPGDPNNPLYFVSTPQLPEFSREGAEKWYFLRFCAGLGVVKDMGEGAVLKTAEADPVDEQMWKLVGDSDNFELISKTGRHAYFDGTCFRTSATATGRLKLVATGNTGYYPAWELQAHNTNGQAMNQYQGAGVGRELRVWTAGDVNNPFTFIASEAMTYPEFGVNGIAAYTPEHKHTLWYKLPATATSAGDKWMEYALPIGNGQLGASLYGGVYRDEIQFNEKTLWSGGPSEYGYYRNFGSLIAEDISGTFGFGTTGPVQDYCRQLDLEEATASVAFKSPDKRVSFRRDYFASYPDQAVIVRYTADQAEQISLHFTLEAGRPGITAATTYADGTAAFSGKLQTVSYAAHVKVVPEGGTMETTAEGITVRNADAVKVILTGITDFDATQPSHVSGKAATLAADAKAHAEELAAKEWSAMHKAHVEDYRTYYGRVAFDLDGSENVLPTDEMVEAYNRTGATGKEAWSLLLEQLYFHYGRYLEIASSRGVDLPSNLQGIWNHKSEAPWHSDIHANINVQMNYWPAEPTNLSEMHLPFLNYICNEAAQPEWQERARIAGQTKGWTCLTENNIFGGISGFAPNYVIANAWYCSHLWQHYRFTLDRYWLAAKALPVMWSACEFWMERLKADTDGSYVCPNEYSPEHGPAQEDGVAHAQQLVRELFDNTVKAIGVVGESQCGIKAKDIARLREKLDKLDKGLATETYTGNWGSNYNGVKTGAPLLREWKKSRYTTGEKGHRHMSHLMCLYPFAQVTPASPYFEAAVNSMKLRGDESTGWSMGWKINLWARALQGSRAHAILKKALKHSTSYGTDQTAGGIYYNLYDSHAPFQIDGNFGACAGIAEMLLQSHTDTLQLLPALPAAWPAGHIDGLRAAGGYEVSQKWAAGKLLTATVKAAADGECPLRAEGIAGRRVCDAQGHEVFPRRIDDNTIVLTVKANGTYTIDFSRPTTGLREGARTNNTYTVAVTDNRLTVSGGKRHAQIELFDPAGRSLALTTKDTIALRPEWGALGLVRVTTHDGKVEVHKALLR